MPAHHGLLLEWQEVDGFVSLRLVTSGEAGLKLAYILDIQSASRSRTRGSVTTSSGARVAVASHRFERTRFWQARLQVSGDQSYELEAHSPSAND